MKIILPRKIEKKIYKAILSAEPNEIGGILMGEYKSEDEYYVVDCTIQKTEGTVSSFVRYLSEIIYPLKRFFQETKHNYEKYNYLGEWHSHPSFSLQPSAKDTDSIWEIIDDSSTNATFVVLIIFRTNKHDKDLEGNVMIFFPEHKIIQGKLIKK